MLNYPFRIQIQNFQTKEIYVTARLAESGNQHAMIGSDIIAFVKSFQQTSELSVLLRVSLQQSQTNSREIRNTEIDNLLNLLSIKH